MAASPSRGIRRLAIYMGINITLNITLNKLIFEWAFGDIPGGILTWEMLFENPHNGSLT